VAVPRGRRHRWAEAGPDVEHHVRLVDPVEGRAGLERLCGELMCRPLDRDRPLWEVMLVPGAAPGRIAAVLRIHHAVADGMAAVGIVHDLFDPSPPGATTAARPETGTGPEARARTVTQAGSETGAQTGAGPRPAVGRVTAIPPPQARYLRRTLGRTRFGLERMRATLLARGVAPTVLLGERGPRRAVVFLDADLAGLAAWARPSGATVNDSLLAAVASGYRAALTAAGETVPAWLPVSVPVALARRGSSANQVGVMLVRLPLREERAAERLRLVAEQTRVEKVRARDQGTLELMRGPLGARIMDRAARRQHLVAGFVTDVPGPSRALALAGAPVTAVWPVAVLAANVRLGVAAVSYAGRLYCGVHFDADHVPGMAFARALGEALAPPGGRSSGRRNRRPPVD
jgi:diacylglycerol O-acyltransferase / wax synthase